MKKIQLICTFVFGVLLSGCFAVPSSGIGSKTPTVETESKNLSLSNLNFTDTTHQSFTVNFDYTGDSNANSTVKIHFCSIKTEIGCDPKTGTSVNLTRSGGKLQAPIDLSTYSISPGDIIKYEFEGLDPDGVSGDKSTGFLVVPIDTSKTRKITQLGFGRLGKDSSNLDLINSIKIDSSGSIFVAGHTGSSFGEPNNLGYDVFVAKLTPAGTLDTSFNDDGIVQLGNIGLGTTVTGLQQDIKMELSSDGSIFIAGETSGYFSEITGGGFDLFALKLRSNGSLDKSYGSEGVIQLGNVSVGAGASSNEALFAAKLDSSNNFYLAGYTSGSLGEANAGGVDGFLVKINSTGALDTSFGGGDGIFQMGNVTVGANASGNEFLTGIEITSSGKIYVSGITNGSLDEANAGSNDIFVASLSPSGGFDTSFGGGDGIIQLGNVSVGANASGLDSVIDIEVDNSGSIYLAGYTNGSLGEANGGDIDLLAIKLTSAGALDTSFGGGDGIAQLGNISAVGQSSGKDIPTSLRLSSSGEVFIGGYTEGGLGEANAGSGDFIAVKFTNTGVLDTTFNIDGIAQLGNVSVGAGASLEDKVNSLEIDSNGNVFLAGQTKGSIGETNGGEEDSIIVKLNSTGNLDTSFNGDGIIQFGSLTGGSGASGDETIKAMVVDSTGNIFLTGETYGSIGESSGGSGVDIFVVKLKPDGSLDTTFNGSGIFQFGAVSVGAGASGQEYVSSIQLDSSGNVYIGGRTTGALGEANAGDFDIFVARLTPLGVLDNSFAGNGIAHLGNTTIGANASNKDLLGDMVLDNSGNVYLAGTTMNSWGEASGGNSDVILIKLTSAGVVDTSYSGDGIVQLGNVSLGGAASGWESVTKALVDTGGNVFIGGTTTGALGEANAGSHDAFVLKINSSGILDTSFSGDGRIQFGNVTIGAGANGHETLYTLNLDSLGKIVIGGTTPGVLGEANAGGRDIYLIRLTSAGALDTSFNTDGIVQLGNVSLGAAASGIDYLNGLVFDPSGNIFITGSTNGSLGEANAGDYDSYVAKLNSSGSLDTSFGGNGVVQQGNVSIGSNASRGESIGAMHLDASGKIHIAGITDGSLADINSGQSDVFLAIMDSAGAFE